LARKCVPTSKNVRPSTCYRPCVSAGGHTVNGFGSRLSHCRCDRGVTGRGGMGGLPRSPDIGARAENFVGNF